MISSMLIIGKVRLLKLEKIYWIDDITSNNHTLNTCIYPFVIFRMLEIKQKDPMLAVAIIGVVTATGILIAAAVIIRTR